MKQPLQSTKTILTRQWLTMTPFWDCDLRPQKKWLYDWGGREVGGAIKVVAKEWEGLKRKSEATKSGWGRKAFRDWWLKKFIQYQNNKYILMAFNKLYFKI